MRIGHEYLVVEAGAVVRATIARDSDQHREDCYPTSLSQSSSRDEFLASALFAPWVHELHACHRRLMVDAGSILSIGSGYGEHDVLLHMAGYDVTSTDLLPDLQREAQRWFPGLPFRALNVLDPEAVDEFEADCAIVTGLDYALDDVQLRTLFDNIAVLLRRSNHARKSLVFTLRFRDNTLTRVIDEVLLPTESWFRRWRRGAGHKIVKRAKGHRRTAAEIVKMAHASGFFHRATCYAGFGIEFGRSALLRRLQFLQAVDRRLHIAANCTVLAFDLGISSPRNDSAQ